MSYYQAGLAIAPRRKASRDIVGISLFHTVGDRDRAVEQINTEFDILASEQLAAMGVDPNDFTESAAISNPTGVELASAKIRQSSLYPFWRDIFSPVFSEWKRFYHDQSAWTEFFTNWEEYEHWFDRLSSTRASLSKQITLRSPDPTNLSRTLWGGLGDSTEELFSFVKKVVYVLLVLVGGYLVVKIIMAARATPSGVAKMRMVA